MSLSAIDRLCFALDYPDLDSALPIARRLAAEVGVLKIGLELFLREGPRAVAELARLGPRLFLDLKLHDIPATVAGAVRSVGALGVDFLTVHAGGGKAMLEAAAHAASEVSASRPLTLLGVTVLTSMDDAELHGVGVGDGAASQVARLGRLAIDSGLGGLVCSVEEVAALRGALGAAPVLVTPGVRPAGAAVGDQRRVGTPATAIESGSSILVVGRPIRQAPDPVAAARAIRVEIGEALGSRS